MLGQKDDLRHGTALSSDSELHKSAAMPAQRDDRASRAFSVSLDAP